MTRHEADTLRSAFKSIDAAPWEAKAAILKMLTEADAEFAREDDELDAMFTKDRPTNLQEAA